VSKLTAKILTAETGVEWVTEHQFDKSRQWRFDYACPGLKIALEQEGGVMSRNRKGETWGHASKGGIDRDMEKYSEAAIQGWIVLRVHTPKIKPIRKLIKPRKGKPYWFEVRAANCWYTIEFWARVRRAVEARKGGA
jgi:hypothetical protein